MKKILKKITSIAAAAVVMSANAALPVSAATTYVDGDIGSWWLSVNPGLTVTISTVEVNTYSGGYWACMTSRGGDCPVNNVTISSPNTTTMKVYEVGKDKARFLSTTQMPGDKKVNFTVKFNFEGGKVAGNQGKIMVASIWDSFEM